MQLTTLKAIIAAAIKAAADNVPQKDCAIYWTPTGVEPNKSPLVATAHCAEWAEFIAAMKPQVALALVAVAEVGSRVCRHQASVDTLRYALDALTDAMKGKP
jgi:hypothetical protein